MSEVHNSQPLGPLGIKDYASLLARSHEMEREIARLKKGIWSDIPADPDEIFPNPPGTDAAPPTGFDAWKANRVIGDFDAIRTRLLDYCRLREAAHDESRIYDVRLIIGLAEWLLSERDSEPGETPEGE